VIKKRPGYGGNNTRNTQGALPIVLGKRPSTTSTTTRPPPAYTQLEKPHMPQATLPTSNVFSQHLLRTGEESPEENVSLEEQETHQVVEPLNFRKRRSLEDLAGRIEEVEGGNGAELVEPLYLKIPSLNTLTKTKMLQNVFKKSRKRREIRGSSKNSKRQGFVKNLETNEYPEESDASGILHPRHRRSLDKPYDSGIKKSIKQNTEKATKRSQKVVTKKSQNILSTGSQKEVAARRVSTPRRRSPKGNSRKRKTKQQPPQTSPQKDTNSGGGVHLPLALHLLHKNHSQDETPKVNLSSIQKNKNKNNTKTKTKTKERKRGRPELPSFDIFELMSDGDYEDEEEEEDDDYSGIGGFFRMIFYPVQMAMSRFMDGFGSADEEDDKEPPSPPVSKYPSYTLYHSAHSNEAYAEPEDEDDEGDDSSSLGSWFSSWFGLQRRTKKIGSTTTTTTMPAPLPPPTKEPAGWLGSWFGFGGTTTEQDPEDDYDSE